MIVRMWHGRVPTAKAAAYRAYALLTGQSAWQCHIPAVKVRKAMRLLQDDDLAPGTLNSILKQAGLKRAG